MVAALAACSKPAETPAAEASAAPEATATVAGRSALWAAPATSAIDLVLFLDNHAPRRVHVDDGEQIVRRIGDTTFLGYDTTSARGVVRAIVRGETAKGNY